MREKAITRAHFFWPTLVVASFVFLVGCDDQSANQQEIIRPINAVKIADTRQLNERVFPGRAKAGQEVNLSFRVSGPLVALPAEIGTEFNKGDIVARIDPRDYETARGSVQGQYDRELAQLKRAEADLRRLKRVQQEDPGATSQAAIDAAQQARDSSAASVNSLRSSLDTAEDRLGYTELKAPFDGVVVETYVENFETVIAKQPILRLLNPASIELVINVPENLIGKAASVESIEVTFDALPGVKVPASIKEIAKEASQATRTYPVTLVMAQPESGGEILPGMAGDARVRAKAADSGGKTPIELPAMAVFTGANPEKTYVWVIDEQTKTVQKREVTLGGLAKFGVRVQSGLETGEWVVTKGVHSVAEGQKVKIHPTSGGVAQK